MRWVYRRQIPSWYLYPRLCDLCMVDSHRRMRYSTNEPFKPDLYRVYSPRWVVFTTAKEPHLPQEMVLEVTKNSGWNRWYWFNSLPVAGERWRNQPGERCNILPGERWNNQPDLTLPRLPQSVTSSSVETDDFPLLCPPITDI